MNKMKRAYLCTLSMMLVIAFVVSLANPSFAEQKKIQAKKGNVICLEVDKEGKIIAKEEYTVCNGLLVFIGMDSKLYSLHGSKEKLQRIEKSPKRRMGYRTPLKVRGKIEGHQKALHLDISSLEPKESQKLEEKIIQGTIVCLIPYYDKGNVKPVVSRAPCNEHEPHAHIIYTGEGEVYALHGSEETIANIEKSSERRNVFLKGKILGNQKGWILFVD